MPKTMPKQKPGRSVQDVQTPPELLTAIKTRLRIEAFSIDLAASADNTAADKFYDVEKDALRPEVSWKSDGYAWLNPPFGQCRLWVQKAAEEARKGAYVVMLVPASVGSEWWRQWVEPFSYVSLLNGRVTFIGHSSPYPKDLALLFYLPWAFHGHEIWHWRDWVSLE